MTASTETSARRPTRPFLAVGDVIADRYRVESAIDATGLSHVFTARDTTTGDEVVLTVVSSPRAEAKAADLAREARALRAIRDPHILQPRALIEPDGTNRVIWVAERARGADLATLLASSGPLSPAQVAVLLGGVGEALDAVHELDVYHRRITLRKLVLRRFDDGAVGLTLTGLGASPLVEPATDTTRETVPADLTTAATVAPEAVMGSTTTDHRVDVYGLAAVAFELLAARRVFEEDNAVAVLARKVAADAPSLRDVAKVPIPPAFADVVARALSRDPAQRPETAGELARELRRAADVAAGPTDPVSSSLSDALDRALTNRAADRATDPPPRR